MRLMPETVTVLVTAGVVGTGVLVAVELEEPPQPARRQGNTRRSGRGRLGMGTFFERWDGVCFSS
jgi:hypothetical protein